MTVKKWFSFVVTILSLLLPFRSPSSGEVIDIIALHNNDDDGVPGPLFTINDTVTVLGIVTVRTGIFSTEYTEIFLQDATAGIKIYADTILTSFALGDSLSITGTIEQYKGMTEIIPLHLTLHSHSNSPPEPLTISCIEVHDSFKSDFSEPNEGRLVRLNNVTLSGIWPSHLSVTDSTGSCHLYIDYDTGLQDITPSYGTCCVTGILKQYDTSCPYTDGYEIVPRLSHDLMHPPGPKILSPPRETDITPSSVTITWETNDPSTSMLSFGTTTNYELGAVIDSLLLTYHAITLDQLSPATMYHCQVTSADSIGRTSSGDHIFITASHPSSTGEINVYFNLSVDTSLARRTCARGNIDLAEKLIHRIEASRYSIDACVYSFDLFSVADALIAAHSREVNIRFIYENREPYQEHVLRLIETGIPVIDDSFGKNDGGGLMHNKFFIFDARDRISADDDWIWTGSYNPTLYGTYENAQNVIEIQDQALAACYTAEFNEMWGSPTDTPDPIFSRFGKRKRCDTPPLFYVNAVPISQYMSPSDWTTQHIIEAIDSANWSIYFSIFSFTKQDLAEAMRGKRENVPWLEIRGVFDYEEQDSWLSQWHNLSGESGPMPWDPPADVWLDGESGLLHHKYMIIDARDNTSEPMLITGSHNWTSSADTKNDENILIIQDPTIANLYLQEFAARYHSAGGQSSLTLHKGDVNSDDAVNILDIILIVNSILGISELSPDQEWTADMNGDGMINILDIIVIINIILS